MYDVAIVGGGVCGCSLLYALSHYRLRVLLLEQSNDVGVATTKANSAIVHAGYDPPPDTLMAKYNVAGNRLVAELCEKLDILYKPCGSLVLAFNEADKAELETLLARGRQNGVPGLRIVQQAELRQMEPAVSEEALCALYAPTAGVVNPWELAFAQAETAVKNGAEVWLEAPVTAIRPVASGADEAEQITPASGKAPAQATRRHASQPDAFFELDTPAGTVQARFVVNAAGVAAARVAAMAGPTDFSIQPSRGEYFLLDKSQNHLAKHVLFQCPGPQGKGVLVSPTVHGNLIVGPNAEPAGSKATTAAGLAFVRQQALRSVPAINFRDNIRNFAGLRATVPGLDDFIVGESPNVPGLFHMAGIKSPGLTAAPAIALDLVRMLGQAGLPLTEKPDYDDSRHILRMNHLDAAGQAAAIAQNPLYGRIVCRCETVTEGEILDALHRPLPPRSLDAVKRRVGPGMGRCQGGFCGPRVQAIIARALGISQQDVPQDRSGMYIITGETKDTDA